MITTIADPDDDMVPDLIREAMRRKVVKYLQALKETGLSECELVELWSRGELRACGCRCWRRHPGDRCHGVALAPLTMAVEEAVSVPACLPCALG